MPVKFQNKQNLLLQDLLNEVKVKCPNSLNKKQEEKCKVEKDYNGIFDHYFDECDLTESECLVGKQYGCTFIGT